MRVLEKFLELKEKRKAVILVHNYQPPEVQDVADYLGDSLGLSQMAKKSKAETIVFCGVHFMAETASILSPDKIVLMPDITAGCPMADMIDERKVIELRNKYPSSTVVSYVNTTAKVKALSDICCTSANAIKVVKSLDAKSIIFLPDKYLGMYVSSKSGKELILSEGYCPIHLKILREHIIEAKRRHPKAEVVVHPECTPDVIELADKVFSTSGICKYAKESSADEMIIGTEVGIIYRLKKENPDKKFYPASELAICQNMKKNNLEKIVWALEDMKYQVKVDEETREKAGRAINRMLELSKLD